jgi:hypothetical protein
MKTSGRFIFPPRYFLAIPPATVSQKAGQLAIEFGCAIHAAFPPIPDRERADQVAEAMGAATAHHAIKIDNLSRNRTDKAVAKLLAAFLEYRKTEGCGCCGDRTEHDKAELVLGALFGVPRFHDGSGVDWDKARPPAAGAPPGSPTPPAG